MQQSLNGREIKEIASQTHLVGWSNVGALFDQQGSYDVLQVSLSKTLAMVLLSSNEPLEVFLHS